MGPFLLLFVMKLTTRRGKYRSPDITSTISSKDGNRQPESHSIPAELVKIQAVGDPASATRLDKSWFKKIIGQTVTASGVFRQSWVQWLLNTIADHGDSSIHSVYRG